MLLVGVTSLLASVLTPGFGDSWSAVLHNSSPYVLSRTTETMPIGLGTFGTWPFLGLMVLGVLLGVGSGRRLVAAHVLLLLLAAVLGIGIMRNIPLFCIAAVPILAVWEREGRQPHTGLWRVGANIEAIDSGNKGYAWAVLAMLLAVAIMTAHRISLHRGFYGFDAARFPVAAVNWTLDHHIADSTFNDLNWGGYLLYRMWPEKKVFIDSQSDFYGEAFIREYVALYEASGDWETELDRFGISSAILPSGAPLAVQLMRDADWAVAYQDEVAVVLVRRRT
jgi:hypothetical protein